MELPKVVSFEERAVWLAIVDNVRVVQKRTSQREVDQLAALYEHMKTRSILETPGRNFEVRVPKIISWDSKEKILSQEFCEGKNLEIELRKKPSQDRTAWVRLTRELLEWLRKNGIFSQDLAPRHVIVDTERNSVVIVDFERALVIRQSEIGKNEYRCLTRGRVHEEFCAFLLEREQTEVFGNIWEEDGKENEVIEIKEIQSKRVQALIKELFGPREKIAIRDLYATYKLLAETVTPIEDEKGVFFPLVELDRFRGAENYVGKVISLKKIPRGEWRKTLSSQL